MDFLSRHSTPSAAAVARMTAALWRQRVLTPRCPATPRLDGKLALVTGGNAGVGLETSLGLARRGADVVIAARREEEGRAAARRLEEETGRGACFLRVDLADLASVAAFTAALEDRFPRRSVDVLVANAGVWPRRYGTSAQGYELAFATNVLGHLLLRRLQDAGKLERARVVLLTGDIYVLARDASADFVFAGPRGGQQAYCRSKLAIAWLAQELQRRFPSLEVVLVHPGVVASGLGGEVGVVGDAVKRWGLLDCEAGAQTPLIAATQPGVVGKYLHNTLGVVTLPADDPALQPAKAAALWGELERLGVSFRGA
ncbi:MAG: SDR family NAD(P)-dependent oxidoreductase [Myxococcota bacterium]